eukprot:TCONS_00001102-protein
MLSQKSSSTPCKNKLKISNTRTKAKDNETSTNKVKSAQAAKSANESDDIIDVTPDKGSKKLKLKLSKINSHSKRATEKLKTQNAKAAVKHGLEDITSGISPIAKSVTQRRKLSLKKPLKRRCSFSPKDAEKDSKKNKVTKEETDDTLEDLTKYLPSNNQKKQLDIKSFFSKPRNTNHTQVQTKVEKDDLNLDETSNDSLLGLVSDNLVNGTLDTCKKEKASKSFEFDLNDSLNLEEVVSTQKTSAEIKHVFMTWRVVEYSVREYQVDNHRKQERVLQLLQIKNEEERAVCHLRDDWFLMEIEDEDIAYVSNLNDACRRSILCNNSKEFITVFPNTLISGTTIASGITCERQAVLNTRFKTEGQNEVMLVGTLTHEIFQWAISNNKFEMKDLVTKMNELLQQTKVLETLYTLDIDEQQIASKLKEYLPQVGLWKRNYLQDSQTSADESKPSITNIVDIEENVWSPYLGFKGKVDVSVEVKIHKRSRDKILAPLELKTGKMLSNLGSVEHRAQVTVYCLLMSERHHQPIDSGLLYYFKTNHLQQVPMPEQEKRAILIKRNDIARRLTLEREEQQLPALSRNKRICKWCPQKQTCLLHFKSRENGESWTSGIEEIYKNVLSNLKDEDFRYFSKWYELLLLEAYYECTANKTSYIWAKSSERRELQGVCFSHMLVCTSDVTSDMKYHYTFERCVNHFNQQTPMNIIPLIAGDRVIVSRENNRVFNETTGYILQVSENEVIVSAHQKLQKTDKVLYRIDKDETLSSLTTPLTNLANLFRVDSQLDNKLRQSIIHNKTPTVDIDPPVEENSEITGNLNEGQKQAICRCLQAKDFVMILGMPGSGKSTTTALLVQSLVCKGKKVLLTSYTHSAVDTILLKLLENGFTKFTRLGLPQRMHAKIRKYTAHEQTKLFTKTHQIKEYYEKQSVFASTCLGVNNPILAKHHFDYCIVDEASQITQPVCIGAVRLADVFVLIGDHNQLPPLVQSEKARSRGMDVSLFKYLSDEQPEAVVTLNQQYRMNKHIMSLANTLVYQNKMKCGNESIANAVLSLPHFNDVNLDSDMKRIIDPVHPVIFVDTDQRPDCEETIRSKKLVNTGEAILCEQIISSLLKAGLVESNLGVICPYRHQLKIIKDEISSLQNSKQIEVETIDKYQGKDKECIIVTFVRSNNKQEVGELLLDWRRINVALTRAKKKLILIGSRKTITGSTVLNQMLKILDDKKWTFIYS